MREIKFRAWSHGAGDPRVEGNMYFSDPFPVKFWERYYNEPLGVELMQYTGLKDKNGKEIYEGDVVADGVGFAVVKWGVHGIQHGCCRLHGYDIELRKDLSRSEVIGNIYENPELTQGL